MTMDNFCKFVYWVLYSNDDYRYIRTCYTSDKGIMLGVLRWTGYDAINVLNDIIAEAGPFKSKLILGRPLYQQITGPYDVDRKGLDLSVHHDMNISKISSFLNIRESHKVQDDRVINEIKKYAEITKSHGVLNVGITTFIIAHYLDWIPKLSEDIIATCRLYGKNEPVHVSLHNLEDELNPIFDKYGDKGKASKKLYQKIKYYVDNGDMIKNESIGVTLCYK